MTQLEIYLLFITTMGIIGLILLLISELRRKHHKK